MVIIIIGFFFSFIAELQTIKPLNRGLFRK